MIRVVVTEEEFHKAEDVFRSAAEFQCGPAPAGEAELAEAVRAAGARNAIVGPLNYTGALYRALPRGGIIARFGVGHDGIDKALATECGLYVTNTPGVLDDSVAEYTIALLLAASRQIGPCSAAMKRNEWKPRTGHEVRGKKLAMIGCGPIGRRVAQIASFGLGMKVTGWKRTTVDVAEWRAEYGFENVTTDFASAVRDADFVALLIPAVEETRHFLNAERLARLPPEARLINAARGSVVDEAALYDALAVGRLAGAALDVYEAEPYVPVDPAKDLRTLDHVLLMPHNGSNTQEANEKMARRALRNLELAEEGRLDEMDLLNLEALG